MFSMQIFSQINADTIISNDKNKLRVQVLYFHITDRCNTCRSIEANVRKTIDAYFQKELKSGELDLYILNCELQKNDSLVKIYDAYGATLAITPCVKGKAGKIEDITTWAFQKVHNSDVFLSELKEKIEKYIK